MVLFISLIDRTQNRFYISSPGSIVLRLSTFIEMLRSCCLHFSQYFERTRLIVISNIERAIVARGFTMHSNASGKFNRTFGKSFLETVEKEIHALQCDRLAYKNHTHKEFF